MPMPVLPPLGRRGALSLAAVGLIALWGCGPSEPIRSYDVKRDKQEHPEAGGPDTVRLLGAIIPTGPDESLFVKFSGTIEEITKHEKAFDEFVASTRVANGKQPTYTAPTGWTEAPARAMRVVTFLPPGGGKDAPQLYISTPFGGTLLMNVNRWRGEVGLSDVTEAELPKVTTELMLGDMKAYKVDFKGPGGKKKMPPFMGKM